jgi:hypothetical protein
MVARWFSQKNLLLSRRVLEMIPEKVKPEEKVKIN